MLEAYQDFWKRYADFNGVSSRAQYWFVFLMNLIIGIVLVLINRYLDWAYALIVFIPNIALFVRRLHDTNRSGWNFFWAFLPFIGAIILLVFLIEPSKPSKYN